MSEIEDPTLKQPLCGDCGLPIRSTSFDVVTTTHRYEQNSSGGVENRYVEGMPTPIRRSGGQWVHDDPRAENDHRPTPQAFGPSHTHDTDYERQEREWRMRELESKMHLGQQFKSDS